MPLPLLPGLQAGASAPSDDPTAAPSSALADFIAGLDDSQVQELATAADAYVAANPDEGEPPPGEEGLEDAAPPLEDEAPTDVNAAPPPEEGEEEEGMEGASQDLDAVATHASADVEDGATAIAAMQELADGDSPQAPIVGKLVALASKLHSSLEKSQAAVEKAVAAEDVQAAAQAGIDCRQFLEAIQALESAAQMMGQQVVAPAATPQDHPALKVWAGMIQRKLPGLAP